MPSLLTPRRRRGIELLDAPDVDPRVVTRSLDDVARSNTLFGGSRAVLAELASLLPELPACATLLDVGTGVGDIPARARRMAADQRVDLTTVGVDSAEALTREVRRRGRTCVAVCGDARALPFRDRSVDVVTCSQLLHHFVADDARRLIGEMDRVARERVVVADLRRSWAAAAGIWLASFPLRFHPVSRHDGVVSVLRGFTGAELREQVRAAVGATPGVRHRAIARVTASWRPSAVRDEDRE